MIGDAKRELRRRKEGDGVYEIFLRVKTMINGRGC
jgi:hypothetical protein